MTRSVHGVRPGTPGLLVLAALALSLTSVFCWLLSPTGRESADGALVRIAGVSYTEEDLAAYLQTEARFPSLDAANRAVGRFVDFQLLQGELAGGSAADRASARPLAPTEEQLEAAYEERIDRYRHPRLARLAYFVVPSGTDPKATLRLARSLRVQAQMRWRPAAQGPLLEHAPQGVGLGELSSVRCDGSHRGWLPGAVAQVGCALELGQLSAPIETALGVFVVSRTGERPARILPFGRVREEIRAELEAEARRASRARLLERLAAEARVVVDAEVVASLVAPPPTDDGEAAPVSAGPPRPPKTG